MNKLIDGLFIFSIVVIVGITITVGVLAKKAYKQLSRVDNCPVPVDFIPTDFEPKPQIGREI